MAINKVLNLIPGVIQIKITLILFQAYHDRKTIIILITVCFGGASWKTKL